jgi:AraC-like DNA-binding protein
LHIEKGSLEVYCNQIKYILNEGDNFFIGSQQVHHMKAATPDTITMVILFDNQIIDNLTEDCHIASPYLKGQYDIEGLYNTLKAQLAGREKFYKTSVNCLITLQMIEIFRKEQLLERDNTSQHLTHFKGLLSDMNEKFNFYDLSTAAEYMNMNTAYFSRLFHKLTGMTFSQYLNYIKIENAVNLIKTQPNMPITSISSNCGFNTIRNFNHAFKLYTGYTPKSLPGGYVMEEKLKVLNEASQNPTMTECKLLESSDI